MKTFAVSAVVLASALVSFGDANPKVVSMPMYRRDPTTISKRDTIPVSLGNAVRLGLYYVNATIGDPPQEVQLQIDTGSSDIWMFGPNSCDSTTSPCLGYEFDVSKSSTAAVLAPGAFSISYVTPGSGVAGDYFADDFTLGGITIRNLTLAVATQAKNVPTGIMGIGFNTDESIVSQGGQPYPNLVDVMKSEGLIGSRSYSLYLDNLEDATGTVLFGGYDTDKYIGDITVLEIFPDERSGTISSMTVAWTSLSVTDSTGTTSLTTDDFPLPAILDSGTTHTIIPPALYSQLANYFEAITDDTYGTVVACSIGDAKGTIDYGFGGPGGAMISVAFSELAIPIYDQEGNPLTFQDGTEACSFGLNPAEEGVPILFGDTFLRSAYVIYDLDNVQIGIAPTNFDSRKSNIVELGGGNVAGVSTVANGVTVQQTATGKLAPTIAQTGVATATKIATTVRGTHSSLAGATRTGASTSSTAQSTSLASPSLSPAFSFGNILIMGSSLALMLFGGAMVMLS